MDPISKFRNKPLPDEVPVKQTTEGTPAEALKVFSAGIANAADAFVIEDPARAASLNIPMKELKISEPPQAERVDASSIFSQEPHVPETPHLQEDVTLAKTFPDGSAIVAELSNFNIGDLKISTDPSHYGIDLSKGGISARDLIAQVLGTANQSTIVPTGGIPAPPGTSLHADGIIDWIVNFFKEVAKHYAPLGTGDLIEGPQLIEDVTGDATDGLRGVQAFGTETSGTALLNKVDEGSKYVNPEGGPTPDIILTPEQAMKVIELLKNINVKPENPDGSTPEVTAEDVKGATPLDPFVKNPNLRFVTDRNPDLQENVSVLSEEQLAARLSAEGGDPMSPRDPDLAPQSPPSEVPEGPSGPGDTGNPG